MKKSNFEEVSFFSGSGTNSSLRVPAILTSPTGHCWVKNNKQWCLAKEIVFIKVLHQERVTERNSIW